MNSDCVAAHKEEFRLFHSACMGSSKARLRFLPGHLITHLVWDHRHRNKQDTYSTATQITCVPPMVEHFCCAQIYFRESLYLYHHPVQQGLLTLGYWQTKAWHLKRLISCRTAKQLLSVVLSIVIYSTLSASSMEFCARINSRGFASIPISSCFYWPAFLTLAMT